MAISSGRLIVHLLGAISSGKGHICKLLKDEFGGEISIIGLGDLVRSRLDLDAVFNQVWGQWIADGNLLPDEVVCPMLNGVLTQPLNSIVGIEGFNRTIEQIQWSYRRGLIGKDSIFYRLNAKIDVCLARHKHRNELRPDGPRTDTSTKSFRQKYRSFINSIEQIDNIVRNLKGRIVNIDADGDIPKDVFPQISGHLKGLIGNVSQLRPLVQEQDSPALVMAGI